MSEAQLKNLSIKSGAVKRTTKELKHYGVEVKQEQKRLDDMKGREADEYDLKQQENVVQESAMMIPQVKQSLQGLVDDLRQFIASLGGDVPDDHEQMQQAQAVLGAADEMLSAES